MATTEHTINDALAELLRSRKASWRDPGAVESEVLGAFRNARRPDILILDAGVSPVVIETEVEPALTVEADAKSRLGEVVAQTGKTVLTTVAVRLPSELRSLSSSALSTALSGNDQLKYCLLSGDSPENAQRWPVEGWLTGSLDDLAIVAQSASVPEQLIHDAADLLEGAISSCSMLLQDSFRTHPAVSAQIANHLQQAANDQTFKMAIAIIADALVFHESLAGRLIELPDMQSLEQLRGSDRLNKSEILKQWQEILRLNYWPVFDIARRLLEAVPTSVSSDVLKLLADTAVRLVGANLYRTYDLTGTVFQRLISDREFLAAYYTTPSAASLLSGLLFPVDSDLPTGSWSSPEAVSSLRVGDFACGTGTLLSTLYIALGRGHELAGGDAIGLHKKAMNDVLYGYDILPTAAHLTASALSGINPSVHYGQSNIYTLAYGLDEQGHVALGSVDMLDKSLRIETLFITSERLMADGKQAVDVRAVAPDDGFHVIAMNPPFKRPTGNEGESIGKVNPMFAGLGNSDDAQKAMSAAFKKIAANTCYNGQAGLGSLFIELANRELKMGGRLGLILPLTFTSGESWEKARDVVRTGYSKLVVLSIVGDGKSETSFSADTNMAECMVLAEKSEEASTRALFVNLFANVASVQEGETLARQVHKLKATGSVARLEDGPSRSTSLMIGMDVVGTVIDAPLAVDGTWSMTRIKDVSLAQAAYQLTANGRIWLPTMREQDTIDVPIAELGQIAEIGPYHMAFDRNYRGAFDLRKTPEGHAPSFPILWSHDKDRERTIAFNAFEDGVPAEDRKAEAEEIWQTATHLHFNRDFRLNSQSTGFQFSPVKSMGGRAWISVVLNDPRHEMALALWGNTTLGLLLHWYSGNRQQSGRVLSGVSPLRRLPVLDVTKLSEAQLDAAEELFTEFSAQPLMRAHLGARDEVRAALDEQFCHRVLGASENFFAQNGPASVLRDKWSLEPSVHGGRFGR